MNANLSGVNGIANFNQNNIHKSSMQGLNNANLERGSLPQHPVLNNVGGGSGRVQPENSSSKKNSGNN